MEAVQMRQRPSIPTNDEHYARCVDVSKRIHWDIERDGMRERRFDLSKKFLPEGLWKVSGLSFLTEVEQRVLSQIQGRTYANIFGLVERFINAKVLEVSREHWLGSQAALEALVRFSDEELKHQAMLPVERNRAVGAGRHPQGVLVVHHLGHAGAALPGHPRRLARPRAAQAYRRGALIPIVS